jgi:hypothetical protein
MDLTIETVFESPDHHLFCFDGDQAIFQPMDRQAYRRSIFLDRRIKPAGGQAFALPLDGLTALAERRTVPVTGWIFHVAHCGSTLLARALDLDDRSLVLREPLALRQIGVDRANATGGDDGWHKRLRLAATLAGRRYRPDAPTIVKANVPVNFVASELLALQPEAPAIFLHFPLRAYLLAILRSPGHRQWVVNVTTTLRPILAALAGPIDGLTVGQRAATLWLAQMLAYAEAIARFPEARSLDAEHLFDAPAPVVAAAAAHFGVALAAGEAESIARGDIFTTYSKEPGRVFGNADRQALQASVADAIEPEIARASAWIEALPARRSLPERLDRSLLGPGPRLIEA